MSVPVPPSSANRRRVSPWTFLLILPYIALCFPSFYNRLTPELFGFPFFYWYQLLWVILASLILLVVYKMTKR